MLMMELAQDVAIKPCAVAANRLLRFLLQDNRVVVARSQPIAHPSYRSRKFTVTV